MVFGLAAAIMAPVFGKMLAALGYLPMNLTLALLTLVIGLAGAYFARAPVNGGDSFLCIRPQLEKAGQHQKARKISDGAGEPAHP